MYWQPVGVRKVMNAHRLLFIYYWSYNQLSSEERMVNVGFGNYYWNDLKKISAMHVVYP